MKEKGLPRVDQENYVLLTTSGGQSGRTEGTAAGGCTLGVSKMM